MENTIKQFWKRGAIFLLILIVFILIINFVYVKTILSQKLIYTKEDSYQRYINTLSPKAINFAFFGDSHTHRDINPLFIPHSYNLAMEGDSSIKTYYKLRKVLYQDQIKINNLILPLELQTLSTSQERRGTTLNDLDFYHHFVSYREIQEVRDDPLPLLWIETNFPFIGRGEDFHILLAGPKRPDPPLGWKRDERNFSSVNKTFQAEETVRNYFVGQELINDVSFEYLLKTIKLARENDVHIIFVKYPVSKEFDEMITKYNLSKEEYDIVVSKKINSSFDGNYAVLDYYDLYFGNSDYFGDPDHLNYIGAEIFSKKVAEDLERLDKADSYLYNSPYHFTLPCPYSPSCFSNS